MASPMNNLSGPAALRTDWGRYIFLNLNGTASTEVDAVDGELSLV